MISAVGVGLAAGVGVSLLEEHAAKSDDASSETARRKIANLPKILIELPSSYIFSSRYPGTERDLSVIREPLR